MKKTSWAVLFLCVGLSGCTLEDVSKLGEECPGVSSVKIGKLECTEDETREVCKVFVYDGVFDEGKCPFNYECVTDESDESAQCVCITPCNTSCCSQRFECSSQDDDGKCVLKRDEACLEDAECLDRDENTPFCFEENCVG